MRAGKPGDPRTGEALDIVEKKRGPDGLWHAEDYYWNIKRKVSTKVNVSNLEVVDWDGKAPTNSLLSTPSRFERLRKSTVERTFADET